MGLSPEGAVCHVTSGRWPPFLRDFGSCHSGDVKRHVSGLGYLCGGVHWASQGLMKARNHLQMKTNGSHLVKKVEKVKLEVGTAQHNVPDMAVVELGPWTNWPRPGANSWIKTQWCFLSVGMVWALSLGWSWWERWLIPAITPSGQQGLIAHWEGSNYIPSTLLSTAISKYQQSHLIPC